MWFDVSYLWAFLDAVHIFPLSEKFIWSLSIVLSGEDEDGALDVRNKD